jgi:DNA-binding IclR family transcriptional regulator
MDGMELRDTKVGVLDKAMAILRVFKQGDVALSPGEIATRTALPLPTVYRLAQAMSEHGLLMKDGQRFRLGLTLLHLGSLVSEGIDVRAAALPQLRWLRERTGENVELQICHEGMRVTIDFVAGSHDLRPFSEVGTSFPLHVGAGGKILLAWLSIEQREKLLNVSLARFSGEQAANISDVSTMYGSSHASSISSVFTIFDREKYCAELDYVRAVGWAASDGERTQGVSALAAPIFNVSGQVSAAVVLAVPTMRLGTMERERFVPLVCAAGRYASHDLGYSERS